MSVENDILAVLTSIDLTLKTMAKARIKAAPKLVASARELDSKFGDPVVKAMPRFWTGDDYKGQHYSACPPELLDMVAELQDWTADRAEEKDEKTDKGKPIAAFRRGDAEKARGWAKRLRDGWVGPVQPPLAAAPGWANETKAPELPAWGAPVDDITW